MKNPNRPSHATWILAAVLIAAVTAPCRAGDEEKPSDKVIDRLEKKVKKDPGDADALYDLVVALVEAGRFEEAEGPCKKYREARPDDPKGWYWQGRAYRGAGDCKQALTALDHAVEAEKAAGGEASVIGPALVEKAGCLGDLGRYEEAIAAYRAALASGTVSDRAAVLINLGSLYNKMGQPQKAKETFDKLAAESPDNPTVHFNLGVVLREAAKKQHDRALFRQAAEAFKRSADLAPKDAQAWFLAGETFLMAGDEKAAVPLLQRYLELAPNGPDAADARLYLSGQ